MAKEIIVSNHPETTFKLGQRTAKTLRRGDIIALQGNLGAGKTTFIQGLAKGLGIRGRLISPTYVYLRQYEIPRGKLTFNHVDLYRLKSFEELGSIHFFDLIEGKAITAIEWPELIVSRLARQSILITFEYGDTPTERIITVEQPDATHQYNRQ